MLKYFFRLLLLIAVVVGIISLIGALLPRDYDFESQVTIVAPPNVIYEKIVSLEAWQEWSKQFNPVDIEGLEIKYTGKYSGVGAVQTWTDPRGKGKLWITGTETNQAIDYLATFGDFPEMESRIELSPRGASTQVIWSSKGSLPAGPFYGFFGAFFPTQMKHEYNRSLEELKTVVENEFEY